MEKKVYMVIERYCLTGFDEEYNGSIIREIRTEKSVAKQRAKELEKTAEKEGQDYKYVVEEHQLDKNYK